MKEVCKCGNIITDEDRLIDDELCKECIAVVNDVLDEHRYNGTNDNK